MASVSSRRGFSVPRRRRRTAIGELKNRGFSWGRIIGTRSTVRLCGCGCKVLPGLVKIGCSVRFWLTFFLVARVSACACFRGMPLTTTMALLMGCLLT